MMAEEESERYSLFKSEMVECVVSIDSTFLLGGPDKLVVAQSDSAMCGLLADVTAACLPLRTSTVPFEGSERVFLELDDVRGGKSNAFGSPSWDLPACCSGRST
jgi:hypothetical protein